MQFRFECGGIKDPQVLKLRGQFVQQITVSKSMHAEVLQGSILSATQTAKHSSAIARAMLPVG
jgi:hypothetical protein